MNLGLPELLVVFAIGLLVFGPKRLPELAKNLGKGIRDFKKALNGDEEETPRPPGGTERLGHGTPPPATESHTTAPPVAVKPPDDSNKGS